ncbi:MAG: ferritin-like domain-containing protein [Alphaproteobacteria bacterium]|nr:ferritin-like domain-containing protein [Alphaproteobacteria bacterium]
MTEHDRIPTNRLPPLAQRLLLTLGLTATAGPGCIFFPCNVDPVRTRLSLDPADWPHETGTTDTGAGDTGEGEGDAGEGDGRAGYEPPANCPRDGEQIFALAEAQDEWINGDPTLIRREGDECIYEYTPWTCCGYGRPYLDDTGRPVTAQAIRSKLWADGRAGPDLTRVTALQRRALAAFWTKQAQAEHSSVAGFHRFALELLSFGAPPALVAQAQRAASQELDHAERCFALASTYAGQPLGPAPMRLGPSAPLARTLAELAASTLRDGAIGETVAAYVAAEARRHTTDPAVAQALDVIVADETEHAELAWKTLQWALEVGGAPVRQAIRDVLDTLEPANTELREAEAPGHGLLAAAHEARAATACLRDVVLPVAVNLLQATRTAA